MQRLDLRDIIAIAFFTALTAVGAWISIPIGTVPIAFANLVALVAGVMLGKWKGALSQVVYLLMGLIGLPVFASFTSGPGIIAGATGGYLMGYIAGAFAAGLLFQYLPRGRQSLRLVICFVLGDAVIYLFGVPWLSYVLGFDITASLPIGLYPFLPGDAVKVVAGTLLCLSMLQIPHFWRSSAVKQSADQAEVERFKSTGASN